MAGEFRINEDYADYYNKFREKEELQKLKDRYGDRESGDSTSESDDEYASAHNPQLDKDWQRTMNALRNRDPKIYSKDFTFYGKEDKTKANKAVKKKIERPYTVADMKREAVLKKMKKFDEDNEVESSSEEEDEEEKPKTKSYYEEQESIKQSFQPMLANDDEEDDGDDLFVEKEPAEDIADNPHDPYFNKWVKQLEESKADVKPEPSEQMTALDSNDQLMMRFLSNKDYADEDEQSFFKDDIKKQTPEEVEDDFRASAPQHHTIKRHARDTSESLRRKEDKRSIRRQELKDRKEKEKKKKKEELKRLKNMKRKEIMKKIDQLKRLTGNDAVGFTAADLEENFDAKEYDELMQKVFNEEYYGEENSAHKKPVFEDDIEWNEEDWDTFNPEERENVDEQVYADDGYEPHCEDPDFNMDADYDPSASLEPQESKKKRKKKSKLAKALERKKPVFEPDDKTFEEYFDEYYKLDYEDMIGDTPCRFKYRSVMANDYGLTAGEVLKADDKELNQWVSVKKITSVKPLEEEMIDLKRFRKRGRKTTTKYNLLPSLKPESEQDESTEGAVEEGNEEGKSEEKGKSNKKKKKAMELAKKKSEEENGEETPEKKTEPQDKKKKGDKNEMEKKKNKKRDGMEKKGDNEIQKKKKGNNEIQKEEKNEEDTKIRKKKRKRSEEEDEDEAAKKKKQRLSDKKRLKAVSDVRLLAYGINPKKIKYGTHKKNKKAN